MRARAIRAARFDFTIAEGYYLYRHRFSVQALDDSGAAGALEVPRGTPHHDEFFGDVETGAARSAPRCRASMAAHSASG